MVRFVSLGYKLPLLVCGSLAVAVLAMATMAHSQFRDYAVASAGKSLLERAVTWAEILGNAVPNRVKELKALAESAPTTRVLESNSECAREAALAALKKATNVVTAGLHIIDTSGRVILTRGTPLGSQASASGENGYG